jgi:ribose/xylose/arabinose/galactoside ABC-type transport system permease subunit
LIEKLNEPRSIRSAAASVRLRLTAGKLSDPLHKTEIQLFVALLLLVALFSALYPESFPTVANFTNMARVASILTIAALAQSFPLLVGGFDVSLASTMGLVSIVAALWLSQGGDTISAIIVAMCVGALVGLVNGILVGVLRVTPFVATLGMMTLLRGLANELSDGGTIAGLPAELGYFGRYDWGFVPSSIAIAAIALAIGWLILARSRSGLYIFAIGGSREAAELSGVPVARYEVLAYTLCGFFASWAGVMLTSRIGVGQTGLGAGYELQSIATAVIGGVAIGGGVGRLSGVVFGGALLVVLTTGLDIGGINQFYQEMVTGAVLIGAVLFAQARRMSPFPIRRRSRRSAPAAVIEAAGDEAF